MEQEGVGGRKCRFADEAEIVDTFSSFSSPSLSPPLPSPRRPVVTVSRSVARLSCFFARE